MQQYSMDPVTVEFRYLYGIGRLAGEIINILQNYYGMCIRENVNNFGKIILDISVASAVLYGRGVRRIYLLVRLY